MVKSEHPLLKRPLYDLLASLQLKNDSNGHEPEQEAPQAEAPQPEAAPEVKPDKPGTSCSLCSLHFESAIDYRSHVRSDLHNYNVKRRVRGTPPVTEAEFEKAIRDLDESLSGSDSDSSEEELARLSIDRRRSPIIWFDTPLIPDTSLGVYRHLLSDDPLASLKAAQVSQAPPQNAPPHVFLCMIGGGHFAAMVVALQPLITKKQGIEERQAEVLAHKTFHRYTTRRKQGGGQAAQDNAKGTAHSAGSSLRRYNEEALIKEVRDLLSSWRDLISTAALLFVRATGKSNRSTLFGPHDGRVLVSDDKRIRSFPFSTRRPTQAELLRCFGELTRVKVDVVDVAAREQAQKEAAALALKKQADDEAAAARRQKEKEAAKQSAAVAAHDDELALHTTQIEALVRRQKAPALLAYLQANGLRPEFRLFPDSPAHHHAPTALHAAANAGAPAIVLALLTKGGADPAIANGDGKTAYELAGDRATRDAFRVARGELGEALDWAAAKVPEALTKAQVDERALREKQDEAAREASRRAADLASLEQQQAERAAKSKQVQDDRRDLKHGKGHVLPPTAEERRELELRGMTPAQRARVERERRARAAEARMRGGG